MLRFALRQTLLTLLLIAPALADSPSEQRGKTFAINNCARCHSIDRVTQSPLKIAPPFRTLHTRYPVETLAEALAEGIQTGHPTMPEFPIPTRSTTCYRIENSNNCPSMTVSSATGSREPAELALKAAGGRRLDRQLR